MRCDIGSASNAISAQIFKTLAEIMTDFTEYYHLEKYIRGKVNRNFHQDGFINAEDFFCIVIWKANRAKSKIAKLLLKFEPDLELCCKNLTSKLFKAELPKERLEILIKEYGFRLPMASAILSILYPKEFSVYDYRVCEILTQFADLINLTAFENIWKGYNSYLKAVNECTNPDLNLTQKDHYLWGKSFYNQLQLNIKSNFKQKL
ncbi:hypothetical protein [Pedobacter psychrophilus]|uniref:hypothetical protein n=1 Tax=Pedobacter psychrophilus TaxID=1826909 RepID=UPI000A9BE515|nr:hypothetical protein [Pedobacter psychrophilus]